MPEFPMNPAPRLTEHLVSLRVFESAPLSVVDAGAFGGVEPHWRHFGDQVKLIAFEPNVQECARLNARSDGVRYIPCALGSRNETAPLHLYAFPPSNSLHKKNADYWSRRASAELFRQVGEAPVAVKRLDDALAEYGIPYVDFIKLDVEGAELDVLAGATRTLTDPSTFGMVFEFMTSRKAYLPQPGRQFGTLFELHGVLEDSGFEMFDISTYRFARAALPQPFSYRLAGSNGQLYPGMSIRGQKTIGDALYCRDLVGGHATPVVSAAQILKGACLFELFGLEDCAVELIAHYHEALAAYDVERLIGFLVPTLRGRAMSYPQYLSTYQNHRDVFMPASGYRFPDHTVHTFDGVFVERIPYRPKAGIPSLVHLMPATLGHGWSLTTPATYASGEEDGITLVSDRSQYSYQVTSARAPLELQGDYLLAYDITVLQGGLTVGVIDGDTGAWVVRSNLPEGSNVARLHLSAPSTTAQVVVANCNAAAPAVSRARVRRLELVEAEFTDAL